MKEILVSENRLCFCNSNKKFKNCCGVNQSKSVVDSYKLYFLLRDVYTKSFKYFSQKYDLKVYLKDFKIYNNIPKENEDKFDVSFKFIDFLLFRAINKESKKPLVEEILISNILDRKETDFLKQLLSSSFFSIFKILIFDSEKGFIEIENIFTKKRYEMYNKNVINLEVDGLLYGRLYTIFSRNGILPTVTFKKAIGVKEEDLTKNIEVFSKRYETMKESHPNLTFQEYINSIEYEIYGGDNPYEEYELENEFEEFKKNNPGKDLDDFLDEIEDRMLEL